MTTVNYYLYLVKHYLSVKVSTDVVKEKNEISRTDEALGKSYETPLLIVTV
jgi:hypothetical protein